MLPFPPLQTPVQPSIFKYLLIYTSLTSLLPLRRKLISFKRLKLEVINDKFININLLR
jgi:hypothetical protein